MRNFLSLFLSVVVVLSGAAFSTAEARQLSFKKTPMGGFTRFEYSFSDYRGRPHQLLFSLPRAIIQDGLSLFKEFSNEDVDRYAYARMKDYARTLPKGIDLNINRVSTGNYRINVTSQAVYGYNNEDLDHIIKQVQAAQKQGMQEYLKAHYMIEDESGQYVFPDHLRVAEKYRRDMSNVARAIQQQTSGMSLRDRVNFALNWVQSIPYNTLLDRKTTSGAGFVAPPGLIALNQGDCDTKSVALGAILRNLSPKTRIMMVYVPGHAFLGLSIPAQQGDRTLVIDGQRFVLIEPAGPGVLPVGIISNQAETELRGAQFSYREFS